MTVQEQPLPTQPLFVCLITGADLYANSLLPDAWPLTSKTHYSKTASYAIGGTPVLPLTRGFEAPRSIVTVSDVACRLCRLDGQKLLRGLSEYRDALGIAQPRGGQDVVDGRLGPGKRIVRPQDDLACANFGDQVA